MHQTIPDQGHWLRQVVTGHFVYYAVPTNSRSLSAFRHYVIDLWRRTLRRRSQKDGVTWERMTKPTTGFPPAHPSSLARSALCRQTPKVGAGCWNWARPDPSSNGHPYRDHAPTLAEEPNSLRFGYRV